MPSTHPDPEELIQYGLGRLSELQAAQVESHIAGCMECCRELELIAPDKLLQLAKAAMSTPGPSSEGTVFSEVPDALAFHPRYKVLDKLGAGGMGVVFKAEHRVMGRTVALKVLNPATTSDPNMVERFRREVRLASRLVHPNIVTAFDADQAGGLHFLVMEFVEGLSLDKFVAKKGALSVPMACAFTRQAALGLQHAFEKGMVHRDVKPHNLMVTRKGQVKVLDFGLAQLAAPEARAASATSPGMTAPGLVVGTPDFLAPEQAKNAAFLDHRADIYSLGCTLHYLLTARPPFPGGSAIEKLLAHVNERPEPITAYRSDVPTELLGVLDKMMAKNPDDRYQTPAEAAVALQPFIKPGSGSSPTTSQPGDGDLQRVPNPATTRVLAGGVVAAEPRPAEPILARATRIRPVKRSREPKPSPFRHPAVIGGLLAAVVLIPFLGLAAVGLLRIDRAGDEALLSGKDDRVSPGERPASTMASMRGGLILLVLPESFLHYPEYEYTLNAFKQKGYEVKTASLTGSSVVAAPPQPMPQPHFPGKFPPPPPKLGFDSAARNAPRVQPDFALKDVTAAVLDRTAAVIFIGAGVEAYLPGGLAAQDVARLIASMNGKVLAATSQGDRVLIEHGLMRGPAQSPVVVPGKVFVARNETEAQQMVEQIVQAIGS